MKRVPEKARWVRNDKLGRLLCEYYAHLGGLRRYPVGDESRNAYGPREI